MHAVDTNASHENKPQVSKEEPRVLDGVGHGQDASADVALQQMDYRVHVPAKHIRTLLAKTQTMRQNVFCSTTHDSESSFISCAMSLSAGKSSSSLDESEKVKGTPPTRTSLWWLSAARRYCCCCCCCWKRAGSSLPFWWTLTSGNRSLRGK